MALFVELDVSLKTVSICIVKTDGTVVWEGKALSEPASVRKALARRRGHIQLVGIEACPLLEWLYGALVDSGFTTSLIETRHAQRFLSSRPNKTDRSNAIGGDPIVLPIAFQGFPRFEVAIAPHDITATDEDQVSSQKT